MVRWLLFYLIASSRCKLTRFMESKRASFRRKQSSRTTWRVDFQLSFILSRSRKVFFSLNICSYYDAGTSLGCFVRTILCVSKTICALLNGIWRSFGPPLLFPSFLNPFLQSNKFQIETKSSKFRWEWKKSKIFETHLLDFRAQYFIRDMQRRDQTRLGGTSC